MNKLVDFAYYSFLTAYENADWGDNDNDKNDFIYESLIRDKNSNSVFLLSNKKDLCVISVEKDRNVVVFRATHNKDGWKDNLFQMPILENGILDNFWKSTLFYRDFVISNIDSGKDLFITGHSRGGALATVLGYYLTNRKILDKVSIITYGSPPVGTSKFKDEFCFLPIYCTRVTTFNDVVSNLNNYIPILRHVGENIRLPIVSPLQIIPILSLYSHHPVIYTKGLIKLFTKGKKEDELNFLKYILLLSKNAPKE